MKEIVADGYQPPATHFSSQQLSRDCSYCFRRQETAQVSHSRGVSPFRKRSNNTPALGRINRAGVLFYLFPDSEKGWGSLPHPQSQGIQPSFKTTAFLYSQHINSFNLRQTRGLGHNSGPPGCLFSHPNSQEPQEVPKVLFSGQRIRIQCFPLRSVIGSPHLYKMCMDAALIPLCRQGIRIANYLDDWVICSPTEQQARNNTKVVLTHLQNLGLKLNSRKSCLIPTKVVTYLGLTLD